MDTKEILDALHELDLKITTLEESVNNTMRLQYEHIENRVTKLERNQMWLITGIVGFVLKMILEGNIGVTFLSLIKK